MDAVFFDLDGTLTNPFLGFISSVHHAMERLRIPAPPADVLASYLGPPIRQSFAKFVSADRIEQAVALYRERYAEVGLFENEVYPGIETLLSELRGKRLFVATSKVQTFATRILSHFGLAQHFETIFGAELDGRLENKTDLLAHALRETGVDPARVVMIGDREHDMIGARNNGIEGFGVLWGYGSADELAAAGAAQLCATPADIRQLLG